VTRVLDPRTSVSLSSWSYLRPIHAVNGGVFQVVFVCLFCLLSSGCIIPCKELDVLYLEKLEDQLVLLLTRPALVYWIRRENKRILRIMMIH